MEKKRANDDLLPAPLLKAAKFNTHKLKILRAAMDDDPEVDLVTERYTYGLLSSIVNDARVFSNPAE